jgi:glutamate formiminotransferase
MAVGSLTRKDRSVLECVVNVSEGRDDDRLRRLDAAVGDHDLLDRHSCVHHNRSVFTLVGEDAARRLTRAAVAELDLRDHEGAHPRLGVVDVVPFVALGASSPADARAARDRFASWAAEELGLPCFLYGPERTLPDVRRHAFTSLPPDTGPASAHPTAGAVAVGVRPVLVAYNLWLADPDLDLARRIASAIRGRSVRALGLAVGDEVQVSMNLIDPLVVGPAVVWDAVEALAPIRYAELVGLVPAAVVQAAPAARRTQLGLSDDVTIERRLADRGLTAAGVS